MGLYGRGRDSEEPRNFFVGTAQGQVMQYLPFPRSNANVGSYDGYPTRGEGRPAKIPVNHNALTCCNQVGGFKDEPARGSGLVDNASDTRV